MVKVGLAVVGLFRVTLGPPTWVHSYVSAAPLWSELPVPFKVTCAPALTSWPKAALATTPMVSRPATYSRASQVSYSPTQVAGLLQAAVSWAP